MGIINHDMCLEIEGNIRYLKKKKKLKKNI